jgi:SagB-type dehydrogenase family enzyme
MVFENFASDTKISADPLTCQILSFFHRWRPEDALFREMEGYTAASLRRALVTLVKHSFLQRSDQKQNSAERAMQTWESWNPAAGYFHFSTKDILFSTDLTAIDRSLRQFVRKHPLPLPVKHHPGALHVALPPAKRDGEFAGVLLARRTWRRFSNRPIELSSLATMLGLTWGVQRWIPIPGIGKLALKTSPSGGALHPTEVYVVARRVKGLEPGVYHYEADRHQLALLGRGATSRQMSEYLAGQWWFGSAAALVIMTAVFKRTQWKYQFPRAYRTVLAEAGHFCQTFCLVATSLGLAPFCSMALSESRIEKDLKIDGVTEGVIYAAGVGHPPLDQCWETASQPEARAMPKRRRA